MPADVHLATSRVRAPGSGCVREARAAGNVRRPVAAWTERRVPRSSRRRSRVPHTPPSTAAHPENGGGRPAPAWPGAVVRLRSNRRRRLGDIPRPPAAHRRLHALGSATTRRARPGMRRRTRVSGADAGVPVEPRAFPSAEPSGYRASRTRRFPSRSPGGCRQRRAARALRARAHSRLTYFFSPRNLTATAMALPRRATADLYTEASGRRQRQYAALAAIRRRAAPDASCR